MVIGCKFGNPITRPAQRGRLFLWKTPVVVVPQRNQKLDQKRDVTEANRQDHQMQRMHADRATQTRETSGVSTRIPCATSELGKSFALPTRNVCWIHNQTENSIETLPLAFPAGLERQEHSIMCRSQAPAHESWLNTDNQNRAQALERSLQLCRGQRPIGSCGPGRKRGIRPLPCDGSRTLLESGRSGNSVTSWLAFNLR